MVVLVSFFLFLGRGRLKTSRMDGAATLASVATTLLPFFFIFFTHSIKCFNHIPVVAVDHVLIKMNDMSLVLDNFVV